VIGGGAGVGARPVLAVGGTPVSQQVEACLREVVVDTDANGPDSCRIVLDDPTRDVLGRSGFDLRADLTVTAGRVGEQTGDRVFDGVVYSVGFDFDDRGSFSTIVAYDRSYELYNGLHTATYQNLTDSDLAAQLAQEVGLTAGRIEPTSVVHEHLAQINETHYEFLARRAREVDCALLVTGRELHFVPSAEAADGPEPGDYASTDRLQLVPGGNVERLTARLTAAQQVTEVEVRGWDPLNKQVVSATVPARSRAAERADRPDQVAAANGSPRHVTVRLPLSTSAECDAAAAAQAERIAGSFVHAEGVARGDPRIIAGAAVSLGQTGGRFDGKLTVSRARHSWDRRGYRTSFVVSGAHDRSMLGLVSGGTEGARGARVDGMRLGIVTNVSDPENRGRVKLRFPWLSDDYESDWARVLQLGAGVDRGLVLLPEVNDEVMVVFENDYRRPYVLGGLYNGVDTAPFSPAVDSGSGTVQTRAFRSRTGHELVFSDADGAETVELRAKHDPDREATKVSVLLDGAANTLRIETSTDNHTVSFLLDASNGSLKVDTSGDVTVAAKGKASISTDKDFSVDAKGKGTIQAAKGLTLSSSSGEVTVRGTKIKLN
jgi:uncharacterized protein involved in type VI secretion and phage assembly